VTAIRFGAHGQISRLIESRSFEQNSDQRAGRDMRTKFLFCLLIT
jgi:hypothetical protein